MQGEEDNLVIRTCIIEWQRQEFGIVHEMQAKEGLDLIGVHLEMYLIQRYSIIWNNSIQLTASKRNTQRQQ